MFVILSLNSSSESDSSKGGRVSSAGVLFASCFEAALLLDLLLTLNALDSDFEIQASSSRRTCLRTFLIFLVGDVERSSSKHAFDHLQTLTFMQT